jgi:putative toxin-antitoxin system antitoxin component (TIGR02293 family)
MSGVGIGAVDAGVVSTVAFYYDIWYSSGMATTRDRENQIFSILGIKRRHGQTAAPDLSVSFVVRSGLPLSSFEAVVSHARVPSGELSAVVAIPPRTLQRRAKRKDPKLDREESDRLARVARLYAFASEVLGSDDAARTWMLTKNRSLDNERPFDLLDTEGDAREVEDALGRIQYGVIA